MNVNINVIILNEKDMIKSRPKKKKRRQVMIPVNKPHKLQHSPEGGR